MFSSCQKETVGNGTQFRATMEGCTSKDGKTALNGTALNWVAGDEIAVYGTAGRGIYTATPQTPATVALFDNVSGETGNAPFRAYYPTTLTTDGVHVTLPAVQTTADGSLTEFPMYAQSDDNTLAFRNLCGALKLHLTKAGVSVSSIEVSTNTPINGQYTLRYTGVPVIDYESNGTNSTVLECENVKTGELTTYEADEEDGLFGVFGFIGRVPNSDLYKETGLEMNEAGYIPTDDDMHTNLPGVFAVGDIRVKSLRQVVTAAADGAIAATQAEKYINENASKWA